MKALPWLTAAAVVGALALGLWGLGAAHQRPADRFVPGVRAVGVASVTEREIDDRLEALGTTASWESIEIRPTVTEIIGEIRFSDGQMVAAGDLLVTLVQDEERARREVVRVPDLRARRRWGCGGIDWDRSRNRGRLRGPPRRA